MKTARRRGPRGILAVVTGPTNRDEARPGVDRVRSPAILAVALMLAAATPAQAGPDHTAEIRACVKRLSSPEEAVRGEAAARLAEIGYEAVEVVARTGSTLDATAWTAFATACERVRWREGAAIVMVAAAHTAPPAHRTRLLALAHHLDARAGVERSPKEVAAIVHTYLIDRAGERCATGHDTAIAILGHAAVPAVLDLVRKENPGGTIAFHALSWIAEPEDVPALRTLLLDGKTGAAVALRPLQDRGVSAATGALLDAVTAGRLDKYVGEALEGAPNRDRVLKVLRAWLATEPETGVDQRCPAARLCAAFDGREFVPVLESWLSGAKRSYEFVAYGTALERLGSPRGIETLVGIVSEPRNAPCCRGGEAPSPPAGRLCPKGFFGFDRWRAARRLGAIAGPDVITVPSRDEWRAARRAARDKGIEPETEEAFLERAGTAFRRWWKTAKDRIRFEPATGRWSVGG